MKRYALPVYQYISVWFYNYALIYHTGWSYIFNPFVPRFFQTPKQGWANMKLHPFLHIYIIRQSFVELYGIIFLNIKL